MKLALPSSLENHHRILKLLYTGCQVVHGNLEITHLHGTPDLSFLQDIAEVQGYVLISHVSVDVIPLDNLRIIRGSQLYNSSYALAVLDNTVKSAGGPGLRELRMKSLTEILLGGVYIWGNPQLCFPNPQRMQWSDVLDEQNPQKVLQLQPRSSLCEQLRFASCPRHHHVFGCRDRRRAVRSGVLPQPKLLSELWISGVLGADGAGLPD
ncbi:hypothetical protein Z043_124989, partial [Scleropages formosus]